MDRVTLAASIDMVFLPKGFKKKSRKWIFETDELVKIITLEKSSYGHSFFVDYGFIVKGLALDDFVMHFGFELPEILRMDNFTTMLKERVVPCFDEVNLQQDLLALLKKQPHLNAVPIVVKRHFNLSENN